MSVAGSDCSAGAGLQADLKTFEAMGVYGLTIATVLTAQNSKGISALHRVPDAFISAQFDALFADYDIAAMKTGLLTSRSMIERVADNIRTHAGEIPLVIDPVISASTGMTFMDEDALSAFKSCLAPLASLITPNLDEAARLLATAPATDIENMRSQAQGLFETLGAKAILLKGGHLAATNDATDILWDGKDLHEFTAPFIKTPNTHGTGCTLSAAITAGLSCNLSLTDAVSAAKDFVANAIGNAALWKIGSGAGPLSHRGARKRQE